MPEQDIEIKPVDWVSCVAIGKPGERTFFIQARGSDQKVSLLLEKIQLQSLAQGIDDFLSEIKEKYTDLAAPEMKYNPGSMTVDPPVDPLYRVGEVGLAYAEDEDMAIILLKEIMTTQEVQDDLRVVRLWVNRTQLAVFSDWAKTVINSGRLICPQCGEPMDPAGHLCPKKNGHKK
jgi:uncharacterized repeat protein (TIGR03847 family)